MSDTLIQWQQVDNKHVIGTCKHGKLYIRMNKNDEVTGLYTMFGVTKKYIPPDNAELSLDVMKLRAEYLVDEY